MTTRIQRYTEDYVVRMLQLAPDFVLEAIAEGDALIIFTKTGFILKPSKKRIASLYPKVKQWVDGYLATTPVGDPSAVGNIFNIVQH